MSEKRAFLVLGPESSGTRLMTRLLIAAGCYGDDGHVQRLDRAIPDVPRLAWRRSLPHDQQWPDVQAIVTKLRTHGYSVSALVMSRDWHAMIASQLAAPHVATEIAAFGNIRNAYHQIFHDLAELHLRFEVVNYEALVLRPRATVTALMARLALPAPDMVSIYDGNAKHYAGLADFADMDRDQVSAAIEAKYGFTPPAAYVTDLLAFVDEVTQRHPGGSRPRLDVTLDLDELAREMNQ